MVKKGKSVELRCRAEGNPTPRVEWTREPGRYLSPGGSRQAGPALTISRAERADTGLYTCTATNGVGSPASTSLHLTVLCK